MVQNWRCFDASRQVDTSGIQLIIKSGQRDSNSLTWTDEKEEPGSPVQEDQSKFEKVALCILYWMILKPKPMLILWMHAELAQVLNLLIRGSTGELVILH